MPPSSLCFRKSVSKIFNFPSSKVLINHHRQPTSTDHVTIPVPEQQHSPAQEMGSAGFGSASSRWQDTEVLVLIQLIESRYREAGPKKGGPFWGEISAEMGRMGYSRSGKKCSEKWANINNIFRRHKETKDAKTWPYFHQLDALYRKKVHGGSNQDSPIYHNQSSYTSSSTVDPNTNDSAETNINNNSNCGGGSYIEGAASVAKKPGDFVKELIEQTQSNHHQQPQPMTMGTQPITMGFYSKMMGEDNDNIEDDEEMDDSDDDEDTTGKIEDKARITNRCWLNTASYFGSANEAASRIYLGFVGTSH